MISMTADPTAIKPVVIVFTEKDLNCEEVLKDLDALMAHGEVLYMLGEFEIMEIIEKMRGNSPLASLFGVEDSKKD